MRGQGSPSREIFSTPTFPFCSQSTVASSCGSQLLRSGGLAWGREVKEENMKGQFLGRSLAFTSRIYNKATTRNI